MLGFKKVAKLAALGINLVLLSSAANAHDHKTEHASEQVQHQLEFSNAWARALPPVVPNGAAYFTFTNHSKSAVVVTGVESDIAKHSMLHESYFDDGKVAMRHIDEIKVESHQSLIFKPGGYHVMLMGLKKPLAKGTEFLLTLTLKNGETLTTKVMVKDAPAMKGHAHRH